jgi:predicted nuclease with TOPRIM domain
MTTQRWTDEMLDDLASSVTELKDSVTELRDGFAEIKDNIDGLRITSQALLQIAAQSQRDMETMKERQAEMEQRQAENDQRFNILLEEVRFLIRGKTDD